MSTKIILGQPLDLTLLEKQFTVSDIKSRLPNATFIEFGWRNLNKTKSIGDDNIGVRAGGTPDATDTLGVDLTNKGWDISHFPPVELPDSQLWDGRTRERTMRALGEEWMPVIRVQMAETSKPNSTRRGTAISLNGHPYSKRVESSDIIVALVADINDGECVRDKDAISEHLKDHYNISTIFNNTNGTITKIINEAYALTDTSNNLLRNKDRIDWEEWLGIDLKKEGIALLQVGGNRDEQFFVRHIIPQLAKGNKAKCILYASTPHEKRAKEQMKDFIAGVNKLYTTTFKAVSNTIPGLNVQPVEDAFEIVGIIPQMQNALQMDRYESKQLVTLNEYLA